MPETDAVADGLERKLATILSADVASYSRLMAEDEEATLHTFRGHKQVFERLVALHRGRVFNTAGDAILAEFGSAVEAVRCATEIQAALCTRNDQLGEDRRVQFRIGINLGDVMVQGGDLLGDGVNVAARLQAAAEPGGICIAGSVYDQIRNKLSLSFRPLGELNYKNIPQPVRTFAIAEADGIGALPLPAPGPRRAAVISLKLWAVAIAGLALVGGAAGVWSYVDYRDRQTEAERAAAAVAAQAAGTQVQRAAAKAAQAAQQQAEAAAVAKRAEAARQQAQAEAASRQQAELAAEKRAIEQARQQAETERQAGKAARRLARAERRRGIDEIPRTGDPDPLPNPQLATALPNPPRVLPAPVAPTIPAPSPRPDGTVETAGASGIYRGSVCLGPGEADPARCYRAQAIVLGNRISGEWPTRQPGATMYLVGEIFRSGEVAIHMHGKRADGTRFGVGDLVGTLRDGKLDAGGNFRNGRTITLNWRKN